MRAVRLWSTRNAGWLKKCYVLLEGTLTLFNPLLKAIGHKRLDKPFAVVEGAVKGFLFDSQSCGQCTLGETGMACPMNCPKTLRNGPCGGVRENGNCEVEPDMPCVWIEAWKGSVMMKNGKRIEDVQLPSDQSLRGTSSWLRATAERAREKQ